MPKYIVRDGFSTGGGNDHYPGDAVDMKEEDAAVYVRQRRLVPAADMPDARAAGSAKAQEKASSKRDE